MSFLKSVLTLSLGKSLCSYTIDHDKQNHSLSPNGPHSLGTLSVYWNTNASFHWHFLYILHIEYRDISQGHASMTVLDFCHRCLEIHPFIYPLIWFFLVTGKIIPVQAWINPESSKSLKLPDLKTIGTGKW